MFAFIDIVNILGGININLDEDLIDPTYKVRNSGVWSTLYYKKGAHHLNGVETLRVARARHFTPAFSRDDRQQKIIGALVNKVSDLNIASDFDKIYNIVTTIFSYLETDIILPDAFSLLSEAKTIKRINKSVVNTSNVLEQTYSTLYHQGLKIEDVDDDFDLGAWILVPKENDWSRIHTFIGEKLEGKSDKYEILD